MGPGGRARASRAVRVGRPRVPSRDRRTRGGRHAQVPHHHRQHRHRAVASLALALAGCSDDGPPTPMPTQSSDRPTSSPSPSTSASTGTPTPTSSASPSGTASVPAGFSLDDGQLTGYPTLGGDLGAIGVVRVGRHTGYDRVVWQFPGTGRPVLPGALRRPADSPTAAVTSSTCPATPTSRCMISSVSIPADNAPRPGTPPPPRWPAPSSRRRARSTAASRPSARPSSGCATASGRSRSPCSRNPTRLVVDVYSG